MKRHWLFAVFLCLALIPAANASLLTGVLSFDIFIPSGGNGPGINAFDIFDFTGPVYGPVAGSAYAANSLTLDNVVLTAFFLGGASQTFELGDIGPGELLDSDGNPVVQFSSSSQFTSATLTATLSQTTFALSDGSTFNASPSISVELTASVGGLLVAGVDFAPIYAEAGRAATPEPGTLILLPLGLLAVAALKRR
jgi:hypothetical protein